MSVWWANWNMILIQSSLYRKAYSTQNSREFNKSLAFSPKSRQVSIKLSGAQLYRKQVDPSPRPFSSPFRTLPHSVDYHLKQMVLFNIQLMHSLLFLLLWYTVTIATYRRKGLFEADSTSGIRVCHYHGWGHCNRQAGMVLERRQKLIFWTANRKPREL